MIFEGMDFKAFQAMRQDWLVENPGAIDAGDTNVYRWREYFDLGSAQFVEKAQYRCHLAEGYLAWLGSPQLGKSNILVSSGVRHSLGLILGHAGHWIRPMDVYPEYGRIQERVGAKGHTYCARMGPPWDELEHTRGWNLLVCDPLKPWGGQLDSAQYSRLIEIARQQDGHVWIDGAYAQGPDPVVVDAIEQGRGVVWLGSLSKGWLSPWTMGVALGADEIISPWRKLFQDQGKRADKLQLSWQLLTRHGDMPHKVARLCDLGRERMIQNLAGRGVLGGVLDPGQGYFLRHAMSVEELAKHGVLAIPPCVFCDQAGQGNGSVLSVVSLVGELDLRA